MVSPHCGRCPCFVLVDLDGQDIASVETIDNPYYGRHEPGQVPSFIHSQGANVMLTGGMGARAIAFFEQFGVQPVTGAAGIIRHALEQYLGGALTDAAACSQSMKHAQQGHGQQEHAPQEVSPQGQYEKDDVGRLREEAEMLQQQLDKLNERLRKLWRKDN